jgi:hypothetical protein
MIYRTFYTMGTPVVIPNPDGSPTSFAPPPGVGTLLVTDVDTVRGIITVSTDAVCENCGELAADGYGLCDACYDIRITRDVAEP